MIKMDNVEVGVRILEKGANMATPGLSCIYHRLVITVRMKGQVVERKLQECKIL